MQRLSAALADRHAIERELGQGGMATVHLAEDTNTTAVRSRCPSRTPCRSRAKSPTRCASSGTHLWAESYDRVLAGAGIFATYVVLGRIGIPAPQ